MECRGKDMDSLEATELRLGLPGTDSLPKLIPHTRGAKRKSTHSEEERKTESSCTNEEIEPPAKSQVVGWPPVRSSFRKNALKAKKVEATENGLASFMKVSMDGAPYLRKIDLNFYNGYKELSLALDSMFKCFSAGSEFIIAYEDKDGDWMLVGDVPWEMFTSSCKRLRIMKASEAKGLGSNF